MAKVIRVTKAKSQLANMGHSYYGCFYSNVVDEFIKALPGQLIND